MNLFRKILILGAVSLPLAACDLRASFSFGVDVIGEGDIISVETLDLDANSISIGNIHKKQGGLTSQIEVKFMGGDTKKVVLNGQKNILDHIDVSSKNGKLSIKGKQLENYVTKDLNVEVYGYTFETMDLSNVIATLPINIINEQKCELNFGGACDVTSFGVVSKSIKLNLSGASEFDCHSCITDSFNSSISGASVLKFTTIACPNFKSNISGASKVEITAGSYSNADYNVSGASKLLASKFVGSKITLNASGGSKAEIFASKEFYLTASGASHITYSGGGELKQNAVSGGSTITQK